MENKKILFEHFNQNKKIYNLNEGYWKRKLNSRLSKKFSKENILFKNVDARGKKIYDANPIFTYLEISKRKAVRIIQDDPREINLYQDINNIKLYLSAWLDKIEIIENREIYEIDELVIAIILTHETIDKTMKLILEWLNNGLTTEAIDNIILD